MPGIAVSDEEEDEDIEFVTAVTAGEKNAKRKSDEFGETMISKKPKHDGAQEKTSSENAVSENDYSEKVISEKSNPRNTNKTIIPSPTLNVVTSTPNPQTKKDRLECDICKRTYQNYQGLSIHKARAHKNEISSCQPMPEDTRPERHSPDQTNKTTKSSYSEKNICVCGMKFSSKSHLKRHQKQSCRSSKSVSETSIVNAVPVNETLEELPKEEESVKNEEEINRLLFMDNVAGGSDEDEDDDLEIVDFVAGSSHKLSQGDVKSEPLEAADTSSSEAMFQMIQQSKYYKENSRMFEICPEENIATFEKGLKSIKGWKVKVNQIRKANGAMVPATHFLSPEGITVRSGVAVLEYLRLGGWGEPDLTALAKKLKVKESNWAGYRKKYLTVPAS